MSERVTVAVRVRPFTSRELRDTSDPDAGYATPRPPLKPTPRGGRDGKEGVTKSKWPTTSRLLKGTQQQRPSAAASPTPSGRSAVTSSAAASPTCEFSPRAESIDSVIGRASTAQCIVDMSTKAGQIFLNDHPSVFQADHAIWSCAQAGLDRDGQSAMGQVEVYDAVGAPLVAHALSGFNACLLAYGQTGSGKTYTMFGPPEDMPDAAVGKRPSNASSRILSPNFASPSPSSANVPLSSPPPAQALDAAAAATAPSVHPQQHPAVPPLSNSSSNNGSFCVSASDGLDPEAGVIPRLCADLFRQIADGTAGLHHSRNSSGAHDTATGLGLADGDHVASGVWSVSASYVEVYCEHVTDLLTGALVAVREVQGQFVLAGAEKRDVHTLPDVLSLLAAGNARRQTASTNMNERSSRSHAVFILYLTETVQIEMPEGEIVSGPGRTSAVKLVDLAGSERVEESGATGARLGEARAINKSLTALGRVVDTLGTVAERASTSTATPRPGDAPKTQQSKKVPEKGNDKTRKGKANEKPPTSGGGGAPVVPYRDSVLTKLLKDSLGGNSKTTLVAAIGPSEMYRSQTLSTLHYATRARAIVNRPTVNEDPQAEELRKTKAELDSVRQQLANALEAGGPRAAEERARLLKDLKETQEAARRAQSDRETQAAALAEKEATLSELLVRNAEREREMSEAIAAAEARRETFEQEALARELAQVEEQLANKRRLKKEKEKMQQEAAARAAEQHEAEERLRAEKEALDSIAAARAAENLATEQRLKDAQQRLNEDAVARAEEQRQSEEKLRLQKAELDAAAAARSLELQKQEAELAAVRAEQDKANAEQLEEMERRRRELDQNAQDHDEQRRLAQTALAEQEADLAQRKAEVAEAQTAAAAALAEQQALFERQKETLEAEAAARSADLDTRRRELEESAQALKDAESAATEQQLEIVRRTEALAAAAKQNESELRQREEDLASKESELVQRAADADTALCDREAALKSEREAVEAAAAEQAATATAQRDELARLRAEMEADAAVRQEEVDQLRTEAAARMSEREAALDAERQALTLQESQAAEAAAAQSETIAQQRAALAEAQAKHESEFEEQKAALAEQEREARESMAAQQQDMEDRRDALVRSQADAAVAAAEREAELDALFNAVEVQRRAAAAAATAKETALRLKAKEMGDAVSRREEEAARKIAALEAQKESEQQSVAARIAAFETAEAERQSAHAERVAALTRRQQALDAEVVARRAEFERIETSRRHRDPTTFGNDTPRCSPSQLSAQGSNDHAQQPTGEAAMTKDSLSDPCRRLEIDDEADADATSANAAGHPVQQKSVETKSPHSHPVIPLLDLARSSREAEEATGVKDDVRHVTVSSSAKAGARPPHQADASTTPSRTAVAPSESDQAPHGEPIRSPPKALVQQECTPRLRCDHGTQTKVSAIAGLKAAQLRSGGTQSNVTPREVRGPDETSMTPRTPEREWSPRGGATPRQDKDNNFPSQCHSAMVTPTSRNESVRKSASNDSFPAPPHATRNRGTQTKVSTVAALAAKAANARIESAMNSSRVTEGGDAASPVSSPTQRSHRSRQRSLTMPTTSGGSRVVGRGSDAGQDTASESVGGAGSPRVRQNTEPPATLAASLTPRPRSSTVALGSHDAETHNRQHQAPGNDPNEVASDTVTVTQSKPVEVQLAEALAEITTLREALVLAERGMRRCGRCKSEQLKEHGARCLMCGYTFRTAMDTGA